MKAPFAIACFSVCLLWNGCKSQHYTADQLPGTQLVFGNGGGITGSVSAFILLPNGQIFQKENLRGTITELGSVPKSTAKKMLQKAQDLHLEDLNVQQPGNLYFFITYKTPQGEARCTWGNSDYKVDARLENFYRELMQMTHDATPAKQ